MTNSTKEEILTNLYHDWSGSKVLHIEKLPASGSSRQYYRLSGDRGTVIGVFYDVYEENRAFVEFSKIFKEQGLNVPEIFYTDLQNGTYLQEDLGDVMLLDFHEKRREKNLFKKEVLPLYKQALSGLLGFQIESSQKIDYSVCYPRQAFDRQSMVWDLSYFKYYFLKFADIPFSEQKLEDDFNSLIDYLLSADTNYFLYRDFQSRNIMVKNSDVYFIDYQGGRKGALHYDVASLLYDAKSDIPHKYREELLDYYISELSKYKTVDVQLFKKQYYAYVLIRVMQAMGAFGFRGLYEKKEHFLQSIPYALRDVKWLAENINFVVDINYLLEVLKSLSESEKLQSIGNNIKTHTPVKVYINSFSYRHEVPKPNQEEGFFVFDCRGLHNPGRYEEYFDYTGRDKTVIDFFEKDREVKTFLSSVFSVVEQAIFGFKQRELTSITVSFGCTGGQHRSVYCAEQLAQYLSGRYKIELSVNHREQ